MFRKKLRNEMILKPIFLAGSLICCWQINAADGLSDRSQQIAQAAEALRPRLIETRRDFHMHPELSNREERTARVIAEKLRALGPDEVKTNVAKHGVVDLLKGDKPSPVH